MTPWKMVFAHRYEEAVAAYRLEVRKEPDSAPTWAEMGNALHCAGKLQEALKAYQKAKELRKRLEGSCSYFAEIATIQWLLGRREEALQTVRSAVDGVLDRSIIYTDIAGGVSQGVLLWYMGLTLGDEPTVAHALKYLKNRSKRKRIKYYPGHLARYVLGECTFEEVLRGATECADLDAAIEAARTDLRKRRDLCLALFYDGVLARSRHDEAACIKRMRQCHALENPILEVEWFLAGEECKKKA